MLYECYISFFTPSTPLNLSTLYNTTTYPIPSIPYFYTFRFTALKKKLVIRRDKVVVTKVTEQELSQIKDTANQCGMTRSDFIRARALGYKPRQRLSDRELDGLRQLAACRTDMVNFANALHGLTDNEKLRLFRHEETMLEWYEKVAHVTNHVADFLQSTQTANSYPAGTTNQEAKEDGA